MKNSVSECVKTVRGGQLPDELLNIAAGAGYNLTTTELRGFVPFRGQALNDETIGSVIGGVSQETEKKPDNNPGDASDKIEKIEIKTLEPLVPIEDICEAVIGFFGFDTSDC